MLNITVKCGISPLKIKVTLVFIWTDDKLLNEIGVSCVGVLQDLVVNSVPHAENEMVAKWISAHKTCTNYTQLNTPDIPQHELLIQSQAISSRYQSGRGQNV